MVIKRKTLIQQSLSFLSNYTNIPQVMSIYKYNIQQINLYKMETLTANELKAIAVTLSDIAYPPDAENFIMEIWTGIFFDGLNEKFEVNDTIIKQKLEKMLNNNPQQFKILYEKMKIILSSGLKLEDLVPKFLELKLI
ncbi:hypothetical protein NIES2101_26770 [Calothrix sp. HK-06]|nr:hypothetical protein NIES2101_26770 [Calothrix sp. HK-06]